MKNEQFLMEQKLKPIFYYDKDVTVCLLVSAPKNIMARGIAICSDRDMFNKRTGRAKALGRAVQAVKKGCDSGAVMPDTLYTEFKVIVADTYPMKSIYRPVPTDYEWALLDNKHEV